MLGSVEEGTRIIRHDTCERGERYKHETVKKKKEKCVVKNASWN